jgi:hypothetical protein
MGEKIEITSDLFTGVAEQLKHETSDIGNTGKENYSKEAEKIKKVYSQQPPTEVKQARKEVEQKSRVVKEKQVTKNSKPQFHKRFGTTILDLFKKQKLVEKKLVSKQVKEIKPVKTEIIPEPKKEIKQNNEEENKLLEEVLNTKYHLAKIRPEITITSEKIIELEEREDKNENKEIKNQVKPEIIQTTRLELPEKLKVSRVIDKNKVFEKVRVMEEKNTMEKPRIQLPDIIIEPSRIKPINFNRLSHGIEREALKKIILESKNKKEETEIKLSTLSEKPSRHYEEQDLLPDLTSNFDPSVFRGMFPKQKLVSEKKESEKVMQKSIKKFSEKKYKEHETRLFNIPSTSVNSLFKPEIKSQIKSEIKPEMDPIAEKPIPILLEQTPKSHLKVHKNINLSNRNNPVMLDSVVELNDLPELETKTMFSQKKENKKIPSEIILEYAEVREIKNHFFELSNILSNAQKSITNSLSMDKKEEQFQIGMLGKVNEDLKSSVDFLKKDFDFRE